MKKSLLVVASLLLIIAVFSAWKIFGPSVSSPEGKYFFIRTGESFEAVKKKLYDSKVIKNRNWYDWAASLLKFKTVRAGKYLVAENTSLFNFIRMLKNGRQTPVNLVITKLRTKEDLASRLGKMFEFDSTEAIRFLGNNDSLKQYELDSNTVMAVVLPNTYTYFWNTTPKKIFQKLYNEYHDFWNEDRKAKLQLLNLSATQVITLASIIDEESNYAPEKPNIASVYLNRISKGMPLQADPTIKFALKDFGLRRIYEKHLAVESPYNTYRNKGLPPGPICTAQAATIDAVLNAPKTDYLYFVAKSDFSGAHVFAASYEDHLKYAKEYQQALNRQDSVRKANP